MTQTQENSVQPLRSQLEIDNEYRNIAMLSGDKLFKIEVLKYETQQLQLRMSQLTQEKALPPLPEHLPEMPKPSPAVVEETLEEEKAAIAKPKRMRSVKS